MANYFVEEITKRVYAVYDVSSKESAEEYVMFMLDSDKVSLKEIDVDRNVIEE